MVREYKELGCFLALVLNEENQRIRKECRLPVIQQLLEEFSDATPSTLPLGLPPT